MKALAKFSHVLLGFALAAFGLDEFAVFLDVPPRQCLAAFTARTKPSAVMISVYHENQLLLAAKRAENSTLEAN
jgi:hypothetical protein